MGNPVRRLDIFRVTEADFGDEDWITIIREGESENGRNYKRATLEKAVQNRVYENMRMFVDHTDGPPLKRSIRELVSGIDQTKLDTSFPDNMARVRGKLTWYNDEFREFASKAKKHIGVSHDAMLKGFRSHKNGRKYEDIDEIKHCNSVDWVVYPSAGGGFDQFYAKEGVEMAEAIDWEAIDEKMLKEKAPDLYQKLIAVHAKEAEGNEGDGGEEPTPTPPPVADPKVIERLVESTVTRVLEGVETKQKTRAEVQGKVSELVARSTLPELTKKRVISQFTGAEAFEEDAVKEAIETAKAEVKAIAGPRVQHMGLTSGGKSNNGTPSLGRAHEALEAAFGIKKTSKKEEE
jgi:hypothetical protein